MVKSNLQHEDSKMISKVESSEPLRILADKNLKLKFATSIKRWKGLGKPNVKPSVNWHLEQ